MGQLDEESTGPGALPYKTTQVTITSCTIMNDLQTIIYQRLSNAFVLQAKKKHQMQNWQKFS